MSYKPKFPLESHEKITSPVLFGNALSAPYNQLQENVGHNLKIDKNVIDPAKVVELEVEHALGVAASLITCKAIIPEFDEHDPKSGYESIAKAILTYTKLWAKDKNLLKEGLDEADRDALMQQNYLIDQDNA